jgi:hypothetical protein
VPVNPADVNLLGEKMSTTKKNTQTLIEVSTKVGLEVTTEITKYMLLFRHQNAGQNEDIRIANGSFENIA